MVCPQCETEYRPGFTECADCGVPLVDALPPPPDVHPEGDFERVYATSDAAVIPVIHSVLAAEGIAVMTKGEAIQDFFVLGRLGPNLVGPVEFFVAPDDVEAARRALADFSEELPEAAD